MHFILPCPTPLGQLFLTANGEALTGAWFAGQRGAPDANNGGFSPGDTPPLAQARQWLEVYFQGSDPGPPPPIHLEGTAFQQQVWAALRRIPYGQVITYQALARAIGRPSSLSARAVGGAVGRNPISLLIPCHRVVGAGGALTGYAGGLERKRALLALEGADPAHPLQCLD